MTQPIIGFSAFILIVYIIIRSANKSRKEQNKKLIESLKAETELFVEQTKISMMTIGLNNRDFLFNRCDLYLTKNAMIILGVTKDRFFLNNSHYQLY